METREEILKKKYGFNKASYKYIPAGGELLKYIGQVVIMVDFEKKGPEAWEDQYQKVKICSITDFDPMTMTYLCKYQREGAEGEDEVRIIPEGFSWGDPEETGKMKRFVPYSLHCTIVEDEMFYGRVQELYNSRPTLGIEALKTLSGSKDLEATLKYTHNIGAAIKLEDGQILWIRLVDLKIKHHVGTKWSLSFSGTEGPGFTQMINEEQEEYDFEDLGKFKIIDLAD